MGTMYSGTEESLLPSQSRMEPPLRSKAATSENSSSCLDNTVWPDSYQNLLAVMLSPLYGECHTSGKRLQPVTQISLCQISVGKSVCNGFPERLGFRTSLEITFWAIPKQSHSRISPSMLTTKRSSPSATISATGLPLYRLRAERFRAFPSGSRGVFCLRSEETPGKTFIGKPLKALPWWGWWLLM